MAQINLQYTPKAHFIRIKELTGKVESSVNNSDTFTAVNVIDQLVLPDPVNGVPPISALDLTAADRDRILAVIYILTYGERVDTMVSCDFCGKSYEVDFSLNDLVNEVYDEASSNQLDSDGNFTLDDGRSFRLPTGRDELTLVVAQPDQNLKAILKHCVIQGDPTKDPKKVAEAIERIAPPLNIKLDTVCAECSKGQAIGFDIQTYLLESLRAERIHFNYEIHLIARVYRWSLEEIYSLPRSQRQAYVSLIEDEISG